MTRLLTAFLIVMLLPATAAAAAPSCPDDNADELGGTGEVWGIGPDYVIAGVPERNSAAGGIVVREGRHTPRTVTLAHVPGAGAPAPGDRFGAALASGMVSFGRPCNDLVAGAPGRNGTGEAYLLRGSTGARPREAVILRAPDAAPGDAFGAAVALSPRDESADHDIWVGAPGRDVAGQADAGAIYHWALNADGVPSFVGVVTQGPGLDAPEAGDRLGEVLAPAMGAAIAGLPHEDAGDRADAGAVMLLPAVGTARFAAGSEAGARLGAAVDYRGGGIAAGAPGADVRGRKDAGLVADFSLRLQPRRTFRQGVRGVPGRAEAGDRFGSALASGSSLRCQEDSALAVGVPGEDFRGLHDAGAVTLIQGGDITSCHSRELAQGRGLPGRAHSRERTGTTLGIAPDRPGLDEDTYDTLLVGVPSGEILAIQAGYSAIRRRLSAPPGAPGYGSVFAQPAPQW